MDTKQDSKETGVPGTWSQPSNQVVDRIEADVAAYQKQVFDKHRASYPPGPEGDREAAQDAAECANTVLKAVFSVLLPGR